MATPANEAGLFITEMRDNSAPVHYALQVKSFSSLLENNIDEFETNEFDAGGYKWKMILYPNGDNNTDKDHISLHVVLSDESIPKVGEAIYATVRFSVLDQVNDTYFTMQGKSAIFHRLKLQWGISKFMALKIFNAPSNGYLVNDNCMLGVSIFVLKSSGIGESLSLKNDSLPYLHEWKLTKFSSLHEIILSESFTVGNYKWYLKLHPKGDTRCNKDYLSLFLYLDNTELAEGQKVCATFTLRLKGEGGVVHRKLKSAYTWFCSKNGGFGSFKFMSLNEFRKLIRDDCCIIEAEVAVLGEVNTLM